MGVPKATTTSEFRNSTVHVDRDHVYIHSQLSTSTAAPIVKSTGHIAKTQIRGSQHNSSSILSKMNPAENSTGTMACDQTQPYSNVQQQGQQSKQDQTPLERFLAQTPSEDPWNQYRSQY